MATITEAARISYIGGPTALIEIGGSRFLTDPTFDRKGTDYDTGIYTLRKLSDPTVPPEKVGTIDCVLLSHDHHFDNLDRSGRQFLSYVDAVYTTKAGAERLGGHAVGLDPWESVDVLTRSGRALTITGTPCRHGPVNGDRGPVTGFVLNYQGEEKGAIYITGDTVFYEGVTEVAKRFDVSMVIAFLGAAVVKEVGDKHLTMTAEESIALGEVFDKAAIVPLHFEGWAHFSESKNEIEAAYEKAGLLHRLKWLQELQ